MKLSARHFFLIIILLIGLQYPEIGMRPSKVSLKV